MSVTAGTPPVSTMNTWWSDDTNPLPTEGHSSTGEFQILDLLPRDVLETLPSFDALMGMSLGRCLNS